jgi:hypothetical protein
VSEETRKARANIIKIIESIRRRHEEELDPWFKKLEQIREQAVMAEIPVPDPCTVAKEAREESRFDDMADLKDLEDDK